MEQNIGRREKKKLVVKDKIIQAALEVFLEKGFNDTTVADIMNKADLGTGTFYNYFESKEDMINHCLREQIQKAILSLQDLKKTPLSATAKLTQILITTGKIFEENKTFLGLFQGLLKINPDIRKQPSHGNLFKNIIMEVIKQGQEEGEFIPEIPTEIVTELIHGILQSTLLSNMKISFSDNLKFKLDVLLEGIRDKRRHQYGT